MYWIISLAIALLFSVTASGMNDANSPRVLERSKSKITIANPPVDETEKFEQIYNLNLDGSVKASNISGNIKLTTWDSPQVRLVAIKTADSADLLKEMELRIDSTPESFSVKVKYRNHDDDEGYWRNARRMSVEYELTVPRTALIEGISSVSGDISIDGAGNKTKASSVSGDVRGSNLAGTAKLSSVSGEVEADFSNIEPGSDIKLNSVSGNVNLKLPSYAGATVNASTVSGKISNDFGLKVDEGKYVGSSMKGTFGDGSVSVKLSTVSGRIEVGRQ